VNSDLGTTHVRQVSRSSILGVIVYRVTMLSYGLIGETREP